MIFAPFLRITGDHLLKIALRTHKSHGYRHSGTTDFNFLYFISIYKLLSIYVPDPHFMRRRTAWRVRNNPLEIDLFERSSQTLEATETDSTFDPTEPVEMARNDEGNARKRLSDYARPVLQRPVTIIHAPLGRGANFRIDSHVMSMLPIFHGKPSKDPYRHVDELSQVCEINHLQNVPADTMKMKLFPATLRDRAKDWFLKLGKEFTSWTEMEEEFLRKYYSVGKTTYVRKAIREFTQGSSETFHEAWERLRDLTRECHTMAYLTTN